MTTNSNRGQITARDASLVAMRGLSKEDIAAMRQQKAAEVQAKRAAARRLESQARRFDSVVGMASGL